jgi:CRP-like cAMP-binding protein
MQRLPVTPADTAEFSRIARGLRLFASMKMAMLDRILGGVQAFACRPGDRVCVQGEPGDFFFVVQEGHFQVSVRRGALSRARKVATLGSGDCFGEMALLNQAPRNATVTCLAASRIFALPALHFQAVLAENPEFSRVMNDLAAERQVRLDHQYE